MCNLLNKEVEFFNPFGSDILKGYILEEIDGMYMVKIKHGVHHGQVWQIWKEDVLDEYGDLETEEKFLYFGDDDAS